MLTGVGLCLVWLIITHSLAAYFAKASPHLALQLNPGQPVALAGLARSGLLELLGESEADDDEDAARRSSRLADFAPNGTRAADDLDGDGEGYSSHDATTRHANVRSLAERTIEADPLNAGAFYVLGQLAASGGEKDVAATLMQAAARRSFREAGAVYHLLQSALETQDYPQALDHADAILRTSPRLTRHLVPLLARLAEDEEARGILEQRLAANPPWRSAFLSRLPSAVTDARTPLVILLALRESVTPPTTGDLRSYLNALIRHDFHELAYYAWLQFLSSEDLASTGPLFNGRFERPLSGLPFDWAIRDGSGASIQVTSAAGLDHGRALYIEFGHGRVVFGNVTQMTLLAPGTYRFTGRLKGELAGPRGLVWRVSCAGGRGKLLGSSEMMLGLAPTWRSFGFAFEVPGDRSCRAQQVRLILDARSASERLVTGAVWYADLAIERM